MNTDKDIPPRIQSKDLKVLLLLALLIHLFLLLPPPPAFAEEKSIGVIIAGDIKYYRDVQNIFMSKLNREGHADRVKVLVQTPYPDSISLSNAVRKLIAVDVDVIVTYGASATVAAYNEKTKIPIVYADVYESVASRLKAANITGVSSKLPISSLLRYLRGIAPVKTLGIVYSSGEEDSAYQAKELYKLSDLYGLKVEPINLQGRRNIKALLSNKKFDAIIITHSCMANMVFQDIEDFAKMHKVPVASLMPGRNFIIALYANPKELGEKSAERVIKILNGTSPERISRTCASDTELVFNLKEAVSIGFDIPVELVTEATKLIK